MFVQKVIQLKQTTEEHWPLYNIRYLTGQESGSTKRWNPESGNGNGNGNGNRITETETETKTETEYGIKYQ